MGRLLIVVDYQNDFVNGSLGFEDAELLEAPIAAKIEEYRANDDDVVFTFDIHYEGYLETEEGKHLPLEHCMEGTQGYELYGKIADLVKTTDPQFAKPAFGSFDLANWLVEQQRTGIIYSSIELVGLVSNICVLSNAVIAKTVCPDTPIIVDAQCTSSYNPDLHEKALDVLEGIHVEVANRFV